MKHDVRHFPNNRFGKHEINQRRDSGRKESSSEVFEDNAANMALHNNTKVYPAQTSAHSTDDVHFSEVDIGNDKTDEQPKILDDDSRHRYMLTPSSPIRVGWDIFILVLLGFIFVAVPLGLAFGDRFERHMVEVSE